MKKQLLFLFLLLASGSWAQKYEQLALTPPLGWNSWNTFATDINEQLVRDMADAFVKHGLRDAGYQYIVLDDGWMAKERDAQGRLQADPVKFPSGMKALADYIHARGLKFGLYNCAGATTCAGYPGSRGYEYIDARSYAEWEVDFLKYDWCNTAKLSAPGAYATMRDALRAAGRPIVFSICEWGDNKPWEWGAETGHMWRVTGDITPCWDCELGHGSWSSWGVWPIIDMRKEIRKYSGPGHWNDFDMLEVGNGLTPAEDRSHFGMWAMLASPLMLGNDLRSASAQTLQLLANREIVAINQDSLGIQAFRYTNAHDIEVWAKPLAKGEWALIFVNRNNQSMPLSFDWKVEHIDDQQFKHTLHTATRTYSLRDAFLGKDLGTTAQPLKATLAAHDMLLLRLSPKP